MTIENFGSRIVASMHLKIPEGKCPLKNNFINIANDFVSNFIKIV